MTTNLKKKNTLKIERSSFFYIKQRIKVSLRVWIDFVRKSFLRMRQRNLNIRHPIRIKIHTCPKLNVHILCQHNSVGPFFITGTYGIWIDFARKSFLRMRQ